MLTHPTHTPPPTVGGVVGFSIVEDPNAVLWHGAQDEFPYFKGISSVVTSWFISPVLSGILASLLFFIVRLIVLRSKHSYERAFLVSGWGRDRWKCIIRAGIVCDVTLCAGVVYWEPLVSRVLFRAVKPKKWLL